MNEALAYVVAQRMERTAAALRKNNMEAYCVKTADEVVPLVKTLLAEGRDRWRGGQHDAGGMRRDGSAAKRRIPFS